MQNEYQLIDVEEFLNKVVKNPILLWSINPPLSLKDLTFSLTEVPQDGHMPLSLLAEIKHGDTPLFAAMTDNEGSEEGKKIAKARLLTMLLTDCVSRGIEAVINRAENSTPKQ